jgi:signal transduction histidine kinase
MTLHSRILAGCGVAIAIVLLPALFAANRLAELEELAVEGRARHAEALVSLGTMRASLADLDRFARSYVATGDEDLAREAEGALETMLREHRRLSGPPYTTSTEALSPMLSELTAATGSITEAMPSGRVDAATELFLGLDLTLDRTDRALGTVADSIGAVARRDLQHAETLSASSRQATLLGMLLALLVATGVATWASGALTTPLRHLGRAMARVADGDFDPPEHLPADRRDEIGDLTRSFLVMSERLADLDRLKAEFIGVASHELKTPINAIHGYAELIQEEFGEAAPEEYGRMVDGIAEQARVMARLVDRLMDLSRLEAGAYRVQLEPVFVQDLVTGVLRAFEILARQRSVTLDATVEPGTPETLVMDLDLIRDEVLGNLVSNALRHTPSGGRVVLSVGPASGGASFTVTDTGPGIPEEERDLVFRKYYRGSSEAPGTGLGLAIARETVQLHGGRISLLDRPAEGGASFRVTLPSDPRKVSDAVPPGG